MSDKTLQSNIRRRLKFSDFRQAMEQDYYKNMTEGKLLLCPNETDEALEEADENSQMFESFSIRELNSHDH